MGYRGGEDRGPHGLFSLFFEALLSATLRCSEASYFS